MDKKFKKDKDLIAELENQIKEIRHQLAEQLRCLDTRMENHASMTTELIDFYQRRADVEYEYARGLDRISKQILARHKAEKQKREQWSSYSTNTLWQSMLTVTSKQGRDRVKIGDIFSNIVVAKLNQVKEDLFRVHRKCKEVALNLHEELMKAIADLHSFMKTYHLYNMESEQSKLKLQRVESQRSKIEQKVKKLDTSKQFQSINKKTEKHRKQAAESDLKATRSRNEYLLALNSANAALRKFFVDDIPDLINASNYGFHLSLNEAVSVDLESQRCLNRHDNASIVAIDDGSKQINAATDLQSFLQLFQQAFSLPRKLNFVPHRSDTICEVKCPIILHEDMETRVKMISDRLHHLKLENDELWKTLETTDGELIRKLSEKNFDVNEAFESTEKPQIKRTTSEVEKQHQELVEAQDFYLNKFKAIQLNSNMIARLSSKCSAIEKAMKNPNNITERPLSTSVRTARRRVLGNMVSPVGVQPKLFGGSIEEYVAATQQSIPNIILFCTKFINRYGINHQGVFRIPGLQHEINEFKNIFEKGEEPQKVDQKDLNSIAGVFKLYFRELSNPLFPLPIFDQLLACGQYNVNEPDELKKCIDRLQELLLPLPRPILVVIRYLFAFLNHLSEFSDENMMDPHNLAVCFGPTLLPVGRDKSSQNAAQQNAINDLVRILIVYQEFIFPTDFGPVYEKYISEEDNDFEESVDNLLESVGSEFNEDGIKEAMDGGGGPEDVWDNYSLEQNNTLKSYSDKRQSAASVKQASSTGHLNSTTSLPLSTLPLNSPSEQLPYHSNKSPSLNCHSDPTSPIMTQPLLQIREEKSPIIVASAKGGEVAMAITESKDMPVIYRNVLGRDLKATRNSDILKSEHDTAYKDLKMENSKNRISLGNAEIGKLIDTTELSAQKSRSTKELSETGLMVDTVIDSKVGEADKARQQVINNLDRMLRCEDPSDRNSIYNTEKQASSLMSIEAARENSKEEVLVLRICEDADVAKSVTHGAGDKREARDDDQQMHSPTLTTAEVFAGEAQWGTIKKGSGGDSSEFVPAWEEDTAAETKPIFINEDEIYQRNAPGQSYVAGHADGFGFGDENAFYDAKMMGGRDAARSWLSDQPNRLITASREKERKMDRLLENSKSKFASHDSLLTTSPLSSCSIKTVTKLPSTLIVYNRSDTSLNIDSGNISPQSTQLQNPSPNNNYRAPAVESPAASAYRYRKDYAGGDGAGLSPNFDHLFSQFRSDAESSGIESYRSGNASLDAGFAGRDSTLDFANDNQSNVSNNELDYASRNLNISVVSNGKPGLSKKPSIPK